ncbi:MAG: hypothetical protein FJ137_09925 [Deltaproteobacteria bacterium]|nr:hypothetical protein [Deltaproteobacteria bacterium]
MRMLCVTTAVSLFVVAVASGACPSGAPKANARKITTRAELIGGPRALGEVGDWLIQNDRVRFIVQDAGFSRGFGVFGGALLDADLVRKTSGRGSSDGGVGKDNFGEMFPAFFLEALEPREVRDPNDPRKTLPPIEIENDGTDGKAAVLIVRGTGGDFIALTQTVNTTLLGDDRRNPTLLFETRYILEPGAQHLKMTTKVQNIAFPLDTLQLPNATLGDTVVPTPFGDVLLFGAGNKVFAPTDAGFDIRFTLEKIYNRGDIALPALPGIAAEFVASAGPDVSYGLLAEAPTLPSQNFVAANATAFPGQPDHALHIPFIASAFTGVFQVLPPSALAPNDSAPGGADEMEFTRYFLVGDGDVASISDQVYALLGDQTGRVLGRARFAQSGEAVTRGSVVVLGDDGRKVTQMKLDEGGRFQADLRPGTYDLVFVKDGLATTRLDDVVVQAGATTQAPLSLPPPARLVLTATEQGAGRVPAKVTLVGTTPADDVGKPSAEWLYDLSLGEDFRYTDFIPDVAGDDATLRYIEDCQYTADGTVALIARPGKYTVVVGRGAEYTRVEQDIELVAGRAVALDAVLERVVDTTGYVGADFHLHSVFSLDSNASLQDRITSYAGEGVELAVSTDHNFVVDYRATIETAGLSRFINSAVGLELTTIDRGHFNGFPLERGSGVLVEDADGDVDTIASRTYGSFEWALRNPADIFADLRSRGHLGEDGRPGSIVLQVNHPRDSILGYFDQYGVNADTLEPEGQSGLIAPDPVQHPEFSKDAFSFDFDALEVFNGKRFEFLGTFKVPNGVTRDPVSCCPLSAGEILRDRPGPTCGDDVDDADCSCTDRVCAAAAAVCDARQAAQVAAGRCNVDDTRYDVAFPGVVDDWIKLLLSGKRVVGTANSDSHEPEKEEPGSPRTYIRAPSDDPAQLTPDAIVKAFADGDVLMTNGPFVRVTIDGKGLGQTVTGATQTLSIHVEQAPWVKADTLKVFSGTTVVHEEPFDGTKNDFTITVATPADTVLLVEVSSTKESSTLFPSIYPNEIPPLQFTDVIGSLGSSFGFGVVEGALQPRAVSVTTPFAMTNPIWVDVNGDGFDAPRSIPGVQAQTAAHAPPSFSLTRPVVTVPTAEEARRQEARAAWEALPLKKKLALSHLPRWLWPSNDPRDVRRSLVQFTRHSDP